MPQQWTVVRVIYVGNEMNGTVDGLEEVLFLSVPQVGNMIDLPNGWKIVRQVIYKVAYNDDIASDCNCDMPSARPTVLIGEPTDDEMRQLRTAINP